MPDPRDKRVKKDRRAHLLRTIRCTCVRIDRINRTQVHDALGRFVPQNSVPTIIRNHGTNLLIPEDAVGVGPEHVLRVA